MPVSIVFVEIGAVEFKQQMQKRRRLVDHESRFYGIVLLTEKR